MEIKITKPTVELKIGDVKLELTDSELEALYEVLRVHLKKDSYYLSNTFTVRNPNEIISCTNIDNTGERSI